MEKVYTLEQVAEALSLNLKTIQKWVREGKIKGKKLGREWRISESALQGFWDSSPESKDIKSREEV